MFRTRYTFWCRMKEKCFSNQREAKNYVYKEKNLFSKINETMLKYISMTFYVKLKIQNMENIVLPSPIFVL